MTGRGRFWGLVGLAVLVIAEPGRTGEERAGAAPPDFREIVQRAKGRVFPAVVYVKCIRESHERGKKASEEISGSGVIISPEGELITNWHVVDKASEVRCLLYDGSHFHAEVRGSDKDTDLALLRLRRPAEAPALPHAVLGDSSALREGDFVMAMGAPWGMARSVSIGIIMATGRYLPKHSEYSLWLQTDASISPGNSGGPLVDTEGRIVGVNTRAISWGGDIGFSIPASTVRLIVARIRQHGKAGWSWTGLKLQPLRDFDRNIYFDAEEGVVVAGTEPESPARRGGIQPNDRILRIDGEAATARTQEDLPAIRRRLGTLSLGKPVKLVIARGKEQIEIELTPREKGAVEGEELDCPRWDFTAKTINRFDNPALYFHRKEGVFVFGVKDPGNARDAGLRRNDILLQIGSKPVKTLGEVREVHRAALEGVATKHRIVLTVLRDGLMHHVVLDFLRDYERE